MKYHPFLQALSQLFWLWREIMYPTLFNAYAKLPSSVNQNQIKMQRLVAGILERPVSVIDDGILCQLGKVFSLPDCK